MNGVEAGGTLNLVWARTFMDELAAAGVRMVIVAPGSRSTPLVLAADDHPDIRTLVHLDERSAGFLALGYGKGSGRPAAVVTTSGTAVANLFPAVVEASQSETPLLLLTADRPPRLRGADANQAIDQVRIFGAYPVSFHEMGPPDTRDRAMAHMRQVAARAVAESTGPPGGPVHVNFPFDKPLHPDAGEPIGDAPAGGRTMAVRTGRPSLEADALQDLMSRLRGARRGIVVSGPTSGGESTAAREISAATGFPLLADPLGARFGSARPDVAHADHYDLFLREPAVAEALEPDLVIRVGRTPTSVALAEHVARSATEVVVIDDGRHWKDHSASATLYLRADPDAVAASLRASPTAPVADVGSKRVLDERAGWRRLWQRASAAAADAIAVGEAEARQASLEPLVTRAAVASLPDGGLLFASSSMPIRDVDAYVAAGRELRCLGNRGASGIDGIASSALGAALSSGRSTLALVGDLAFLHDLNGLVPARALGLPVVFLVLNNDGGGIFHLLPIREHEPAFTRYFATPHGLDFRHAGALYDLPFRRVVAREAGAAVEAAFEAGGTHIIEVTSDRDENSRWRKDTVDEVGARVARALGLLQSDEK